MWNFSTIVFIFLVNVFFSKLFSQVKALVDVFLKHSGRDTNRRSTFHRGLMSFSQDNSASQVEAAGCRAGRRYRFEHFLSSVKQKHLSLFSTEPSLEGESLTKFQITRQQLFAKSCRLAQRGHQRLDDGTPPVDGC